MVKALLTQNALSLLLPLLPPLTATAAILFK